MWCNQCQRGQKELPNGECPQCGAELRALGIAKDDTIKTVIKDIDLGGGYTEDKEVKKEKIIKKKTVSRRKKSK